jgi:hypothetical protein
MDSSDAGASLRRHSLDVVIAFWSVDRFGQTFEYRYETGPPVDWPDWAEMDTDRPDAAVAIRSGNENIDDGGHGKKALTSKNSFFVAGSLQQGAPIAAAHSGDCECLLLGGRLDFCQRGHLRQEPIERWLKRELKETGDAVECTASLSSTNCPSVKSTGLSIATYNPGGRSGCSQCHLAHSELHLARAYI